MEIAGRILILLGVAFLLFAGFIFLAAVVPIDG